MRLTLLFRMSIFSLSLYSVDVFAVNAQVPVEPQKVLEGLWGGKAGLSETSEVDDFFLRSLDPGASNNSKEFEYFAKNKCKENSVRCYLILSAGGNLLLDSGDQENGLKAAIYGYSLIHESDFCPVAYEIVVINYKLKKLKSMSSAEAAKSARTLLDRVKESGGVSNNLRVDSCAELSERSPIYFEKYAGLIFGLMDVAGGEYRSYAKKTKN